jgi:hypothetical protein
VYFFTTIDNPPLGSESNPVHTVISLTKGTLASVLIDFPLGCRRLVKIYITYNARRLIPFNLVEPMAYDDKLFAVPMDFDLGDPPYELEVFSWNLDDTYPHQLTVGVNMLGVTAELNPLTLGAPQAPAE